MRRPRQTTRPPASDAARDWAEDALVVQNRLREAREARGLGQGALARKTGLTRQALYAIETNRYQPNVAVALRLARALGLAVEEIFAAGPAGPIVDAETLGHGGSGAGT